MITENIPEARHYWKAKFWTQKVLRKGCLIVHGEKLTSVGVKDSLALWLKADLLACFPQ